MTPNKPGRRPGSKNKIQSPAAKARELKAAKPLGPTGPLGHLLVDLKVIAYASGSGAISFTWQGTETATGAKIACKTPTAVEIIKAGVIRPGWALLEVDGQLVAVKPIKRINAHILELGAELPYQPKALQFAYDPASRCSPTEFQLLGHSVPVALKNISWLSSLRFFLKHEHEITSQLQAYAL